MASNMFSAARRASGISVDSAAEVVGVSRPTMTARERDSSTWRLGELRALYDAMDDLGKELLLRAVKSEVTGE